MIELLLITNIGGLYTPSSVGDCSQLCVVIAGTKVCGIVDRGEAKALESIPGVKRIDARKGIVCPGFVDLHMHVTGGGGEAGPASRCPESKLSELIKAGITTVVGLLGTDSVSRSQENLVSKCQALRAEGISSYHWVGGYSVPPPTVCGAVQRDIMLLDSCVGVGEIAVSDHRSSAPTAQELAKLACEARVGGMLSGKAGMLCCHMGDAASGLAPLRHALSACDAPITTFLPTHVERNPQLVAEGVQWMMDGGRVDLTASSKAVSAVLEFIQQKVDLSLCSVSSDAYGSYPVFDEAGRMVRYEVGKPRSMLDFVRSLHNEHSIPLDAVLPLVTCNPANCLKLRRKGRLEVGADADVLVLDERLNVAYAVAKGVVMKTPEWTRGGCFESGPGIRPWVPEEDV